MSSRLSTVAADLPARLEAQPAETLRKVAVAVALLAVERTQLADSRLEGALQSLTNTTAVPPELRSAVQQATDELDEIAWEAQDKADEGLLDQQDYQQAFRRARAAACVGFALEPDAIHAALESVYEAQAATGDLSVVREVVEHALSGQ